MASYFFKSNARDDKDSAPHTSAGSTPARSAIHLFVDGGLRCTRYAPPPAARTWSPPAHCATSAGKPRTSAARAAAIHTHRKPTGSHGPVCWQGIRDASAQATDLTDAAGTMDYAAPPAPSPTIGRLNASSSSKPDWTPTTRNACAACASAATTARPQGRNLQASTTDKTPADTHRLRHQNKNSIEAKPTTPAARVERHERRKRPSLLDSIRDSSQQQASQTKNVAKQTEANRQNTHGGTP